MTAERPPVRARVREPERIDMNIVQITPGAGGMYCGGCFRDNALVGALRDQGHEVLMVPLYLPLTLDEPDNSRGTPTFFGGINVYLEQQSAWFRKAPGWLHRLLDSPFLLRFASKLGARTRAEDLGALTLSMLRGEEGNQARELQELVGWLRQGVRPDVICLSNALLIGLARELKRELGIPIACLLSGEDTFLDALPESHRAAAWRTLAERARDVAVFIAPSRYFADLMAGRLGIAPHRIRVVPNGINLDGFTPRAGAGDPPVLGYFARLCREKGLELLADTYQELRRRGRVPGLRLKVGGGLGPSDEPLVRELQRRFEGLGYGADVSWHPNLSREAKIDFLKSLDVFCTPALYGEAFGLYVVEALACAVPVVQPRHAGFPELVEASGGGVVAEPDPGSLATAIESLLLDPGRARALGAAGRAAVERRFTSRRMAEGIGQALTEASRGGGAVQTSGVAPASKGLPSSSPHS